MKKRLALAAVLLAVVVCAVPSLAFAKTSTKLAVSLTTSWEHYDYVPVLTATLKTSSGKALKYTVVSLYYNGSKVASKKTNSAGRVAFNVGTAPGDMQASWTVRYAGSRAYKASSSARKSTLQHFHYLAEEQIPFAQDTDSDGVDEYMIYVDLFLPGNSVYAISTSVDTYRWVYPYAAELDLYPGDYSEMNGSFAVPDDSYCSIQIECPDANPVSVIIW